VPEHPQKQLRPSDSPWLVSSVYAIDCYLVAANQGVSWIVLYWTFLLYAAVTLLVVGWCRSMLSTLHRVAYGGLIANVVSYICIIYSFLAMTTARVIASRGQYIENWLVQTAVGMQYAYLIILFLSTGILFYFSPPGKPFWKNRKRLVSHSDDLVPYDCLLTVPHLLGNYFCICHQHPTIATSYLNPCRCTICGICRLSVDWTIYTLPIQ
jgi:hypothetical protein